MQHLKKKSTSRPPFTLLLTTGSQGFTLVEVMITAAIIGILALGIASVTVQSQKAVQYDQFKRNTNTLIDEIRSTLADQTACSNTFSSYTFDTTQTTALNIASIKDKTGGSKYQVGSSYDNNTVKVNTMTFTPNKNAESGSIVEGLLLVSFSPVTQVTGPTSTNAAQVPIWVGVQQNTTTHAFISCIAFSKTTDGIWTVATSGGLDSITFGGAGNVGIGVANPTAKLEVGNGGLKVGSADSVSGQGAFLQWNRTSGDGATWLVNQKGGGAGGVVFGESDTSNNLTETMRITGAGKVGIGTTNPSSLLQVSKNSAGANVVGLALTNPGNAANSAVTIDLDPTSAGTGARSAQVSAVTDGANHTSMIFRTSNAAAPVEAMRITNTGAVGIGSAAPTEALDIGGNATMTGSVHAIAFYHTSDRTLKKDIVPISVYLAKKYSDDEALGEGCEKFHRSPSALDNALQLTGVHFRWKKNGEPSIGVIAQDVRCLFPELVQVGKADKKLSVDYNGLSGVLIEALRDLEARNQNLEAKIQSLQQRMDKIEKKLDSSN